MRAEDIQAAVKYIDSWLAYKQPRSDLPGLAVAVRHKGKLLYNHAFGYANLENKQKLTPGHVFRIASHSKMFTATAIMQLQENGKLQIDDKVITHIPWLKNHKDERWKNVTVRQLLSHSAGVIRDGIKADCWILEQPFPDLNEFKRQLLQARLVFDTNTLMKYSNFGFTLLGQVVEAASKTSYKNYVEKNIIQPLGLKNTFPELPGNYSKKQFATGYTQKDVVLGQKPIENVSSHSMVAATGFCATAEDITSFLSAHQLGNNTLLGDESKKEMQRPQWKITNSGAKEEYGLGFYINHSGEKKLVGHGGGWPGQTSHTSMSADDDLVISVLTNKISGNAQVIAAGIFAIIEWFGQQKSSDKTEKISQFNGRFADIWWTFDIIAYKNSLTIAHPNYWRPLDPTNVLKRVSDTEIKLEKIDSTDSIGESIVYKFGEDGIDKVEYGGMTSLPEEKFIKKYKNKTAISLPKKGLE